MISLNEVRSKREAILRASAAHGAHHVRVFGSCVRGEEGEDSDVDFLVEMDDDRSLIDHIALIRELEEILGCPVDVVSKDALHHAIRDRILSEGVPL